MSSNQPSRKLASARAVADFYGIGISTLWRWLKLGLIPEPIKIGRRTLWDMSALDRHVAELSAQRTAK